MDPEVLSEAKDFVSGWIDKAGADGSGVNYEVSQLSFKRQLLILRPRFTDGMQRHQRQHGPLVWSILALHYGRGILLRGDQTSQVHSLHVLRW